MGSPIKAESTKCKKSFRSQFFLLIEVDSLLPGARSATRYSNLSFRQIDSGRFSAGHCLRRGDPFSHPSGSSAWQQVRAIHPHLNRKGGRKGHTPPARFVGTVRIPRAPDFVKCPVVLFFRISFLRCLWCMICFHLPRLARSRGALKAAPNSLWRVQKTFSTAPCSFTF